MTREEEIAAFTKAVGKYVEYSSVDSLVALVENALNLINQQQEENKRLRETLEEILASDEVHEVWYHQIAREALEEEE